MVAIGLLVNCSVLDVSVSKCGPILVIFDGGDRYLPTHTCLLPCGQEMQTCDQDRVSWDGTGGSGGLLAVAQ